MSEMLKIHPNGQWELNKINYNKKANLPHGLINPEGQFIPIHDKADHAAEMLRATGINLTDGQIGHENFHQDHHSHIGNAHRQGWIHIGNSGLQSVTGHNKILSDRLHPATVTLRKLMREHYNDADNLEVATHYDKQDDKGNTITEVDFPMVNLHHYTKHGKFPKERPTDE